MTRSTLNPAFNRNAGQCLPLGFLDPPRHRQVNLRIPIQPPKAVCASLRTANTCARSRVYI